MYTNTLISIDIKTPGEISSEIAGRVKQRRLELNLTQAGLSKRAGIKLPTYRKFERTGLISLEGLLRIAFALNALDDFDVLFSKREYEHIQDVLNETKLQRKRGKRND